MSPPPVPSARYYDAVAPQYDTELAHRARYVEAVDALVVGACLDRGARTLLDVGCGNGRRLARILERTGCEGAGIDASPAMVDAARSLGLAAEVVDIAAPGADLGRMAPPPPYDVVTALWNVLGHVGDAAVRVRALRAMREALAPDGVVILDVNNRHNVAEYGWRQVAGNSLRNVLRRGHDGDFVVTRQVEGADAPISTVVHVFTRRELVGLCRAAGLVPRTIQPLNYGTGAAARDRFHGQLLLVAGAG